MTKMARTKEQHLVRFHLSCVISLSLSTFREYFLEKPYDGLGKML